MAPLGEVGEPGPNEIRKAMRKRLVLEPMVYEDNPTKLAEDTAQEDFDCDHWLDEPDHDVWTIAVEVMDETQDELEEALDDEPDEGPP